MIEMESRLVVARGGGGQKRDGEEEGVGMVQG